MIEIKIHLKMVKFSIGELEVMWILPQLKKKISETTKKYVACF